MASRFVLIRTKIINLKMGSGMMQNAGPRQTPAKTVDRLLKLTVDSQIYSVILPKSIDPAAKELDARTMPHRAWTFKVEQTFPSTARCFGDFMTHYPLP
jgi:hypothetical protein